MKKQTRTVAAGVLLLMILTVLFSSCSATGSNAPEYKDNADGCGLYRYTSSSTETAFTVPDTHAGKPVTELMDFCLANAEYLTEIHIGKNVKTIGIWAMTNCQNLEAIYVSEENPYFKSVDGVLYNKDMTQLLVYPNAKSKIVTDESGNTSGGEFVVPDTVKSIRANAFYLCGNLRSITFNEGLETVGDKAFLKCGGLESLALPSTLVEIGTDAFSYLDNAKLTVIEIPASVEKIGDYAFFSSSSSVEKVIVHKNSAADLELGKDWLPNQKNAINKEAPVEFVGEGNG